MHAFDLVRPKGLVDALRALSADRALVAKAGGIDLLDRMKEGLERPSRVLDLRGLAELKGIERTTLPSDDAKAPPVLRIGALVTLAELAASPLVREHASALAEAASEAATPQIRNVATVGGNVYQKNRCWYYRSADEEPCHERGGKGCPAKEGRNKIHAIFGTDGPCVAVHPSNLAPALVALGAVFEYRGEAEGVVRSQAVAEWTTGLFGLAGDPSPHDVRKDPRVHEVLTSVFVPIVPGRRSAYREVGERESFDWALASCAVALSLGEGGVVTDVKIVLGAVARTPLEIHEAVEDLKGKKLTPELARAAGETAVSQAKPLAENAYKIPIARALVARALLAAAAQEGKK